MKTFALNILFLAGFIPMNLMAQDTLVVEAKKIPFSAEFKSIHLAEKSFESNVIKVAKGFDYDEGSVDTDLVEKAEGQVVKFVDASGNTVICGYNPFDRFSGLDKGCHIHMKTFDKGDPLTIWRNLVVSCPRGGKMFLFFFTVQSDGEQFAVIRVGFGLVALQKNPVVGCSELRT